MGKQDSESKKCVYLLIGQRGSGKSEYAKRLIANQPGLVLVSRDEILVRFFGSADSSPYGGEQWYALKVMHRFLRFMLRKRQQVKIILDCWTGTSEDRATLIRLLKEGGATKVVALYFVTPRKTVESWFWQKPGIAKLCEMKFHNKENKVYFSEDAPSRDYLAFHKLARNIDSDGFDEVIRINPRKSLIQLS